MNAQSRARLHSRLTEAATDPLPSLSLLIFHSFSFTPSRSHSLYLSLACMLSLSLFLIGILLAGVAHHTDISVDRIHMGWLQSRIRKWARGAPGRRKVGARHEHIVIDSSSRPLRYPCAFAIGHVYVALVRGVQRSPYSRGSAEPDDGAVVAKMPEEPRPDWAPPHYKNLRLVSSPKCLRSPGQIGRPHPVVGSQPLVAGKPLLQDVRELPSVTSSKASPGCAAAT